MDISQSQRAAIARIRALMSHDALSKADRVARINGRYIGLSRDQKLKKAFKAMVESIAVVDLDDIAKPDKRRIVAVCGEPGAGKTTALLRHTAQTASMQPYVDDDGNTRSPVLMMTAPSPCTPRLFAYEGLHKMGYPIRSNVRENVMWKTFRDVLKVHGVMFLIIDEAQHAVDASNSVEITKIANALKNLVQMPDWPLRIVLAGVEPLAQFLSSKQLANRSTIIPFTKMAGSAAEVTISEVMRMIVFDHAEMSTTLHEDEEFIKRLIHGCDQDFGTIVQMIRGAVEEAMNDDQIVVTNEHFANCFESNTGYEQGRNVFLVKNWHDIEPYAAARQEEDARLKKFVRSRKK
ncbi:ATP-binding protein [Agrobacterium rhizogenes]|nr:ATP-binding protein [Rhizobium rhizogenes]NTH38221.1 ATP-binding protein [Rhizobium rhizogenes]NTJ00624.1 ATP-binding protein [Rhizobium rhizogenes]